MSLFETTAYAAEAGGLGGADLTSFLFLGGFVVIFYFLLWRPQSKRRKDHQTLMTGLAKGDEIVTTGGIVGQINKVEDDFVKMQVAPNLELRVQKSAVGATLPKGTLKQLDAS